MTTMAVVAARVPHYRRGVSDTMVNRLTFTLRLAYVRKSNRVKTARSRERESRLNYLDKK